MFSSLASLCGAPGILNQRFAGKEAAVRGPVHTHPVLGCCQYQISWHFVGNDASSFHFSCLMLAVMVSSPADPADCIDPAGMLVVKEPQD